MRRDIRGTIPLDHPDRDRKLAELFIMLHRACDITPSHDNVYVFKCNPFNTAEVSMAGLSKEEFDTWLQLTPGIRRLPDAFTRPLIDHMLEQMKGDQA